MVTKTKATKIKDRVCFNNFTYNLSKEQKSFIKSKKAQQDLAIKYSIYQLYRGSKGYKANVEYNTFSKLYAKSKKSKSFADLEYYTNELSGKEIYDSLVVYLEYLRDTMEKYERVYFKNSINPKQKICIKFIDKDNFVIDHIVGLKEIKNYNFGFDYIVGRLYPFYDLISGIIKYHFYPEENDIFCECRNVNGDYYDACTILYDTKNDTYVLS